MESPSTFTSEPGSSRGRGARDPALQCVDADSKGTMDETQTNVSSVPQVVMASSFEILRKSTELVQKYLTHGKSDDTLAGKMKTCEMFVKKQYQNILLICDLRLDLIEEVGHWLEKERQILGAGILSSIACILDGHDELEVFLQSLRSQGQHIYSSSTFLARLGLKLLDLLAAWKVDLRRRKVKKESVEPIRTGIQVLKAEALQEDKDSWDDGIMKINELFDSLCQLSDVESLCTVINKGRKLFNNMATVIQTQVCSTIDAVERKAAFVEECENMSQREQEMEAETQDHLEEVDVLKTEHSKLIESLPSVMKKHSDLEEKVRRFKPAIDFEYSRLNPAPTQQESKRKDDWIKQIHKEAALNVLKDDEPHKEEVSPEVKMLQKDLQGHRVIAYKLKEEIEEAEKQIQVLVNMKRALSQRQQEEATVVSIDLEAEPTRDDAKATKHSPEQGQDEASYARSGKLVRGESFNFDEVFKAAQQAVELQKESAARPAATRDQKRLKKSPYSSQTVPAKQPKKRPSSVSQALASYKKQERQSSELSQAFLDKQKKRREKVTPHSTWSAQLKQRQASLTAWDKETKRRSSVLSDGDEGETRRSSGRLSGAEDTRRVSLGLETLDENHRNRSLASAFFSSSSSSSDREVTGSSSSSDYPQYRSSSSGASVQEEVETACRSSRSVHHSSSDNKPETVTEKQSAEAGSDKEAEGSSTVTRRSIAERRRLSSKLSQSTVATLHSRGSSSTMLRSQISRKLDPAHFIKMEYLRSKQELHSVLRSLKLLRLNLASALTEECLYQEADKIKSLCKADPSATVEQEHPPGRISEDVNETLTEMDFILANAAIKIQHRPEDSEVYLKYLSGKALSRWNTTNEKLQSQVSQFSRTHVKYKSLWVAYLDMRLNFAKEDERSLSVESLDYAALYPLRKKQEVKPITYRKSKPSEEITKEAEVIATLPHFEENWEEELKISSQAYEEGWISLTDYMKQLQILSKLAVIFQQKAVSISKHKVLLRRLYAENIHHLLDEIASKKKELKELFLKGELEDYTGQFEQFEEEELQIRLQQEQMDLLLQLHFVHKYIRGRIQSKMAQIRMETIDSESESQVGTMESEFSASSSALSMSSEATSSLSTSSGSEAERSGRLNARLSKQADKEGTEYQGRLSGSRESRRISEKKKQSGQGIDKKRKRRSKKRSLLSESELDIFGFHEAARRSVAHYSKERESLLRKSGDDTRHSKDRDSLRRKSKDDARHWKGRESLPRKPEDDTLRSKGRESLIKKSGDDTRRSKIRESLFRKSEDDKGEKRLSRKASPHPTEAQSTDTEKKQFTRDLESEQDYEGDETRMSKSKSVQESSGPESLETCVILDELKKDLQACVSDGVLPSQDATEATERPRDAQATKEMSDTRYIVRQSHEITPRSSYIQSHEATPPSDHAQPHEVTPSSSHVQSYEAVPVPPSSDVQSQEVTPRRSSCFKTHSPTSRSSGTSSYHNTCRIGLHHSFDATIHASELQSSEALRRPSRLQSYSASPRSSRLKSYHAFSRSSRLASDDGRLRPSKPDLSDTSPLSSVQLQIQDEKRRSQAVTSELSIIPTDKSLPRLDRAQLYSPKSHLSESKPYPAASLSSTLQSRGMAPSSNTLRPHEATPSSKRPSPKSTPRSRGPQPSETLFRLIGLPLPGATPGKLQPPNTTTRSSKLHSPERIHHLSMRQSSEPPSHLSGPQSIAPTYKVNPEVAVNLSYEEQLTHSDRPQLYSALPWSPPDTMPGSSKLQSYDDGLHLSEVQLHEPTPRSSKPDSLKSTPRSSRLEAYESAPHLTRLQSHDLTPRASRLQSYDHSGRYQSHDTTPRSSRLYSFGAESKSSGLHPYDAIDYTYGRQSYPGIQDPEVSTIHEDSSDEQLTDLNVPDFRQCSLRKNSLLRPKSKEDALSKVGQTESGSLVLDKLKPRTYGFARSAGTVKRPKTAKQYLRLHTAGRTAIGFYNMEPITKPIRVSPSQSSRKMEPTTVFSGDANISTLNKSEVIEQSKRITGNDSQISRADSKTERFNTVKKVVLDPKVYWTVGTGEAIVSADSVTGKENSSQPAHCTLLEQRRHQRKRKIFGTIPDLRNYSLQGKIETDGTYSLHLSDDEDLKGFSQEEGSSPKSSPVSARPVHRPLSRDDPPDTDAKILKGCLDSLPKPTAHTKEEQRIWQAKNKHQCQTTSSGEPGTVVTVRPDQGREAGPTTSGGVPALPAPPAAVDDVRKWVGEENAQVERRREGGALVPKAAEQTTVKSAAKRLVSLPPKLMHPPRSRQRERGYSGPAGALECGWSEEGKQSLELTVPRMMYLDVNHSRYRAGRIIELVKKRDSQSLPAEARCQHVWNKFLCHRVPVS